MSCLPIVRRINITIKTLDKLNSAYQQSGKSSLDFLIIGQFIVNIKLYDQRNKVGSLQNWEKRLKAPVKEIRLVSHGEQSNSAPLADFRKFIFVLNKWFPFYVCHKRELANKITGILPVSSPPEELWDTETALEDDLTESNILSRDFRTSPFFVLWLRLAFAFPTRSCTMLLSFQASCVATKGSNWILQLGVSVCRLFWLVSVHLWLPYKSGASACCAWLRSNLEYIVTLEPSEFCNDWHQWLYHGNRYVLWVIEISNA